MAEKLQAHVVEMTPPNGRVLELYCGVGAFSLPLAKKSTHLVGIESVSDSIDAAKQNARVNQIENSEFICADVPAYVKKIEMKEKFDTIVLDPPRAGISKKIARRMLRMSPTKIIYVACSLTALQRDLEFLREYCEFTIENCTAFDLFPHTDHVETVVTLRIGTIHEFPMGGF